MIYDDIKNSPRQFGWEPVIQNARALQKSDKFIVIGMGGSHFAADLIKTWRPDFPVSAWSNYGLPPLARKELKESLVIATSYSGNTEETIDGLELALKNKLNVAVMASGGKMIARARELGLPYTVVPAGIQPRSALGYMLRATLALLGETQALREMSKLSKHLRLDHSEKKGQALAKKLRGRVPVVYGSSRNYSVVYNWKIRLNETGKVPAFYNLVPEMNHNELISFDTTPRAAALSRPFHFIYLQDKADDPRITKRMAVMRRLLGARGFRSEVVTLSGKNSWEKIFSSIMLADWTAYYLARHYRAEPEMVKMIEEFKRLVAKK